MPTEGESAEKAAAMWQQFTPNERDMVAIAMFPAAAMEAAEREGFESRPLAVALMRHRQEHQPTGATRPSHRRRR
jgi:hypothetical protein